MIKANTPPSLSTRLSQAADINFFFQQGEKYVQQAERLRQLLPAELRARVQLMAGHNELIVFTSNNAVAQVVRFYRTALLAASHCQRLQVKIDASLFTEQQKPTQHVERSLPAESAKLLLKLADDSNHEPLSRALRRLVQHASKQQEDPN